MAEIYRNRYATGSLASIVFGRLGLLLIGVAFGAFLFGAALHYSATTGFGQGIYTPFALGITLLGLVGFPVGFVHFRQTLLRFRQTQEALATGRPLAAVDGDIVWKVSERTKGPATGTLAVGGRLSDIADLSGWRRLRRQTDGSRRASRPQRIWARARYLPATGILVSIEELPPPPSEPLQRAADAQWRLRGQRHTGRLVEAIQRQG